MMNDKKMRDAMIETINDPLDHKLEKLNALQIDTKEMIENLGSENEIIMINEKLRSILNLREEIVQIISEEAEAENLNHQCQCEDCGKKFNKGDEGDNEKICLRCEANFMAQKNYDRENGHDDCEDEDDDWIDPAGGYHSRNEKDPAKQYE